MKCKKFKGLVFSFQDGRLHGREKAEFERHMRDCPACSGWLQDAGGLHGLLRDSSEPVPAPDWEKSWRRIAAAMNPAPHRHLPLPGLPRWATLAAAFVAVFILGVAVARLVFSPAKEQPNALAEPAFTFTPQDYFAALQPVIAEFDNGEAGPDRVRPLLNDLYLLKLRAARSRDVSLQHLLGDIELVLLEIAHLDRSDPGNVRSLRSLIQEKGLPLKMKVFNFSERKSTRI